MNQLDSFLGIPFGSNKEFAKQKLAERNGILDDSISDDATMVFNGVTFGGRLTESILLTFFDDQFCKASIYIKPKLQSKVIELYSQIKEEINTRYYKSEKDFENYEYPYEQNDGHTETAISIGKAEFICFWSFGEGSDTDDYISVKIDENLEIVLIYEEGELLDKLIKRNEQKNSMDY